MPIALTKKPSLIVFLGLWFVFSLFIFLSYRAIRSADEMFVTPLALKSEFTFPDSWLAKLEIYRRVRNGSLRNSEFFSYVLTIATASGIESDAAYDLADRILESGLDINSSKSGLLPLQGAIIVNDSDAISYLLSRCADPFAVNTVAGGLVAQQSNAFELLEQLNDVDQATNRDDVAAIINSWRAVDDCNDI